jgi:putative SOS response-associated peptidase YedK
MERGTASPRFGTSVRPECWLEAKQPWLFGDAAGASILCLAGLRQRWRDPATLIVTEPTKWMLPHHERMPVLLQHAEIDRWLSGKMEARELHPAAKARCESGR